MAVCDIRAPFCAVTPRPVCLPRGRLQQSLSLAPLDGNERQAQIADAVEQAVERGLVGHLSDECRVAVRLLDHGKVVEPRAPSAAAPRVCAAYATSDSSAGTRLTRDLNSSSRTRPDSLPLEASPRSRRGWCGGAGVVVGDAHLLTGDVDRDGLDSPEPAGGHASWRPRPSSRPSSRGLRTYPGTASRSPRPADRRSSACARLPCGAPDRPSPDPSRPARRRPLSG